ncbi:MAG: hypothetical protein QOJ35_1572 [Solirubrobacteraceae bacterium]|jgi:hypothetical protein|nr:hypothetical protein [Solirubrobacteraceae bacterium]
MARGNPDNLRAAAARKSQHATERADTALRALIKRGDTITFRGVAAEAGCSPDFLYNSPTLRPRIEHLRAQQQGMPRPRPVAVDGPTTSNVVRALSAQLAALKKQHNDEVTALNAALSAAHGELLQLRRELGAVAVRAPRPMG